MHRAHEETQSKDFALIMISLINFLIAIFVIQAVFALYCVKYLVMDKLEPVFNVSDDLKKKYPGFYST